MYEVALFAGAGGGILGGTLLGWRTVCAVEWNPYCRRVLLQRQRDGHLPGFPIWDDVRTFGAGDPGSGPAVEGLRRLVRRAPVVVTAGFPCQPYSSAGKRLGPADDRNLWPDTCRIIREVGPRVALLENVARLLRFDYFGEVLGDLGDIGYDAEWDVVSAAECGAPHLRRRLWALAWRRDWAVRAVADPEGVGRDDSAVGGPGRVRGVGVQSDAGSGGEVGPEEGEGRPGTGPGFGVGRDDGGWWGADPADPVREGRGFREVHGGGEGKGREAGDALQRGEVLADADRVAGGLRAGAPGGAPRHAGGAGGKVPRYGRWGVEPGLGRVADGVADRVDRLRAVGNGQVPVVAAVAFVRLALRAGLDLGELCPGLFLDRKAKENEK